MRDSEFFHRETPFHVWLVVVVVVVQRLRPHEQGA